MKTLLLIFLLPLLFVACQRSSDSSSGDSTNDSAPTINITSPVDGETVSGTVEILASATDPDGIAVVTFFIGETLDHTTDVEPYTYSWDTTALSDGNYRLKAAALDASGNATLDNDTTVTVANNLNDPLSVNLSLNDNQHVGGVVDVTADVGSEVIKVEFYVNGSFDSTDDTAPFSFSWNTATVTDITNDVKAIAYNAGNDTTTDIASDVRVGILVTVTDADVNNTNKSTPASAVELWAVTTKYESSGYETEKVKLVSTDGNKTFSGVIPVMDVSSDRTVIIFDDVFTKSHPYGGTNTPPGPAGSGGHSLVPADDVFSPCDGGKQSGNFMADLVQSDASGGVSPPRLNPFNNIVTNPVAGNDEVFTLTTGQRAGNELTANYTAMAQTNVADFCECIRGLNYVSVTFATSTIFGTGLVETMYFTDNDFDATGAAGDTCGPRIPPST